MSEITREDLDARERHLLAFGEAGVPPSVIVGAIAYRQLLSLSREALDRRDREKEGEEAVTGECLLKEARFAPGQDYWFMTILLVAVPPIELRYYNDGFVAIVQGDDMVMLPKVTTRGQVARLIAAIGGGK